MVNCPDGRSSPEVLRAWGFRYKSQIVWNKDRIGTGYWVKLKHEVLLIGTRGDIPAPVPGEQPVSVIDAPVAGHSEKPAVFAELIEAAFGGLPRLEMFSRRGRPGWDVWGNEAEPESVVLIEPDKANRSCRSRRS